MDIDSSPTVAAPILATVSRLHVFVLGNNGHLYECYWDGSTWVNWTELSIPGTTLTLPPGVAALPIDTGSILHIFCPVNDGTNIILYRYSSEYAQWFTQGMIHPGVNVASEPGYFIKENSVYSYVISDDGNIRTRNLFFNADGHLFIEFTYRYYLWKNYKI